MSNTGALKDDQFSQSVKGIMAAILLVSSLHSLSTIMHLEDFAKASPTIVHFYLVAMDRKFYV